MRACSVDEPSHQDSIRKTRFRRARRVDCPEPNKKKLEAAFLSRYSSACCGASAAVVVVANPADVPHFSDPAGLAREPRRATASAATTTSASPASRLSASVTFRPSMSDRTM